MLRDSALRHESPPITRQQPAVLACALNRYQRAYLQDGLRRTACRFVETFRELDELLTRGTPCDALVLAMQDATGRASLPSVQRIVRDWPDAAIVMICPAMMEQADTLRALVVAGVHQLVFEGMHDTASALASAVENARRECAADRVYRDLAPIVPPELHSIVTAVLGRPDTMTSVEAVANILGIHRRTLVNRCTRSRFLQPGELIVWCRLALIAHFLERTGATVESLALKLGFASHTSLRNLIKRYTGLRATEIRRGGGLTTLLHALRSRIARAPSRSLPIS